MLPNLNRPLQITFMRWPLALLEFAIQTVAILIMTAPLFAVAADPDQRIISVPYNDSVGVVVRLSNQDEQPFMRIGKVVTLEDTSSNNEVMFEKFKNSITRFDQVIDCLHEMEGSQLQPDLAAFNWEGLRSEEDVEVCLYRIATSYATPEDMRKWLISQGINARRLDPPTGNFAIAGGWSIQEHGLKFRANLRLKLWVYLTAHSVTVTVVYRNDGSVYGAGISFNSL